MASGPPQISDPKFVQERETPVVDETTGKLIAAAAEIGVAGVTEHQTRQLRDDVTKQREDFLGIGLDITDDPDSLLGVGDADLGSDLININIDNLIANANTEEVTVDMNEITNMTNDLAATKRAVAQGISPIRALEINTEVITRRYIDRFPGLAGQFQRVAQTALGTENNLLTATMRAQQELFNAAEAALKTQAGLENALQEAAFDAKFVLAKHGATAEIRAEATAQYLSYAQRESAMLLSQQAEDQLVLRGEVTVAQGKFNGRMRHAQNLATLDLQNAIVGLLPPELQGSGVQGFQTFIKSASAEELVSMQQSLDASKAAAIYQIDSRMANSGYISDSQKSSITALQDMIGSVYDVMSRSVSTKEVSEELSYQLNALTNLYGIEFQKLFGRDALFAKEFLAVVPVDSNLHQLISRNMVSQGILTRMMDFWGEGDIRTAAIPGLIDDGFDPDSPDGQAAIAAVTNAAIGSFRQFLLDPNQALANQYEPVKMLNGLNIQFEGMSPDVKRNFLEMMGMEEWEAMMNTKVSPEIRQVIDELNHKVTEWGAVKLNDAVEDFVRDISSEGMSRNFGIRLNTSGVAVDASLAGHKGIPTSALVHLEEGPRGIIFTAKTVQEYDEMGIATDPKNMGNISRMIASLNNVHGQGINAWARAMGNLGTGKSRKGVLRNVLNTLSPPEKEEEEKSPEPETPGINAIVDEDAFEVIPIMTLGADKNTERWWDAFKEKFGKEPTEAQMRVYYKKLTDAGYLP